MDKRHTAFALFEPCAPLVSLGVFACKGSHTQTTFLIAASRDSVAVVAIVTWLQADPVWVFSISRLKSIAGVCGLELHTLIARILRDGRDQADEDGEVEELTTKQSVLVNDLRRDCWPPCRGACACRRASCAACGVTGGDEMDA